MYVVLMKRKGQPDWEIVQAGDRGNLFTAKLAQQICDEMLDWFPTTEYRVAEVVL